MGGRSPHGERGLKLRPLRFLAALSPSLPSRGAWIEIQLGHFLRLRDLRRSPHGERGLKSDRGRLGGLAARRSPHGERGLKSLVSIQTGWSDPVAPLTGSVD